MTDRAWLQVIALLTANWPHSLPSETSLAKWKADLDDLPVEQVMSSVETLYRTGREFPPNGAQIRKEVVSLAADIPTWGEAWSAVHRAIHNYGSWDIPNAIASLYEDHLLIGKFAEQVGFRELCVTEDPPGVVEGHCRRVWEQMVNRVEREQSMIGLPTAGLRQLERVNAGPRQLGAGLAALRRRFDEAGPDDEVYPPMSPKEAA